MKTALFTNWTQEDYVGYWDGKPHTIKAGQSKYLPEFLSFHFARGLTNRELLRTKPDGTLVYPNGDRMTSPKFPEQVPLFMELFNKAYTPDDEEIVGDKKDDVETQIEMANRNRQSKESVKVSASKEQDPNEPQVIVPPDFNDPDDEEFQGKPVE